MPTLTGFTLNSPSALQKTAGASPGRRKRAAHYEAAVY
jgi:hypothetical protein